MNPASTVVLVAIGVLGALTGFIGGLVRHKYRKYRWWLYLPMAVPLLVLLFVWRYTLWASAVGAAAFTVVYITTDTLWSRHDKRTAAGTRPESV